MTESSRRQCAVTWRAVWPGLVFILLLDGLALGGGPLVRAALYRYSVIWTGMFLALPAVYLLAARRPLKALGYHRRQAMRWYAWGVGAGALWRLLDVLIGLGLKSRAGFELNAIPAMLLWLVNALVIVPLFEETFFRGYLQAGLEARIGPLPAVIVQAILFAAHPFHVSQGLASLPSIALFGVIAGVLTWRTRSIAAAYGAHGIANILPRLIQALASL